MHTYDKLVSMLEKELEQFTARNEISSNSLEMIDMITHSLKSLYTIMAMKGSSEAAYDGYSRVRRNYYPSDNYSGREMRTDYGYSGTASKEELAAELTRMMDDVPSHLRGKMRGFIDELR